MKLFQEEYSNDYKNKGSTKFYNLQKRLSDEFFVIFKEIFGFYGASLIAVRTNIISSSSNIIIIISSSSSTNIIIAIINNNYNITSIIIFVITNNINNITIDVMFCFARRNCTENGWYYPDYTQCKTDPFTLVRKEMVSAIDGSAPSMKIISILKQVKNMTVAYKDYSHIAGDLISCVEIIEMLTNYTKHHRNNIAFNDEEALLMQTASTLIRVVEEYGLQAAIAVSNGTEDLTFFIAENVVKRFKVAGFMYRTLTRILSAESAYSMVGQGYEINSAVVALSVEPPLPPKLKRPIIIASNNLDPVQFLCRLLSMLVHYFFLCAFTWIMAEATYMFVWSTTDGPKKRHWIGYFFLGFVPPGIPMAIAWLIKGMQTFESPLS
ncbi:hypothetical protein QZH41_002059 [Actinostola sp. cb2023]|nr:hypothetical protein QZH41_002059 [Actinostola sp. cb2023]